MTNYKLYFKLLKKHVPQFMIYLFFFVIILLTNSFKEDIDKEKQLNIYIVGEEQSVFSQEIKSYLEERGAEVQFFGYDWQREKDKEHEKRLQALIEEGVLTGAMDSVLKIDEEKIEIISNRNDQKTIEINEAIRAYLKEKNTVQKDKEIDSQHRIESMYSRKGEDDERTYKLDNVRRYMNILVYGLSTIICVGIICVSASMNQKEIKEKRSLCPNEGDAERELFRCHFLFGGCVLGILFIPTFIIGGKYMFSVEGLLFAMNGILVTGNLVMISYLLSFFIKDLSLEMIAVNMVSLGSLFLSGILQEQWDISDLAIRIGSLIPTYWFVKGNRLICYLNVSGSSEFREVINSMIIEILFLIAFVIIVMVANTESIEEEDR